MRVAVFGTFDIFHCGHLNFLKQARALGDELVVILARDTIARRLKGASPVHNQAERKELLLHIDIIDKVVLGDGKLSTYRVLSKVCPDIIAVGYDQNMLRQDLKDSFHGSIVRLKPYKSDNYKSGKIKMYIQNSV